MTTWLHFVGRTYYATAHRFNVEAVRFGITRRVSLSVLRSMDWGDRVLLCTRSGKSTVVFAQFRITKLSGFSAEGAAVFAEAFADRVSYREYPQPRRVERGCGSYVVTGEMTIRETPIVAIVDALKKCPDPGKVMVGGEWEPLGPPSWQEAGVDVVRLKDVPFAQGFRPFAYDEFASEVVSWLHTRAGKLPPVVRGFFYTSSDPRKAVADGVAELVGDYRRGSHWEQGGLEL